MACNVSGGGCEPMLNHWITRLCPLDSALGCDTTPEKIGGKAASLLTMAQDGIPVPLTWVIPIRLCEVYYAGGRELPGGLIDELESIVEAHTFHWAVRSGAAESMPGTMESVLDCVTLRDLEQAIRKVLDSWMSPTALAYRKARSLQHLNGTAVILQKMVKTDFAGVLFTRSPLQSSMDTLTVEAVPGFGDQLVSGAAAGQRWEISRESHKIVSHTMNQGGPSLLSFDQLGQLSQYALQIEQKFGHPVDVEWGLSGSEWVFFQARPMEIAVSEDETNRLLKRENVRLAEFRQRGETLWVRHNLCETIPFPTPLTWSILRSFMSGSGGYGNLYRQLGFSPGRRVCQEGFLELIAGQIYVSPQRLPDLYCDDFPFSFDEQEFRFDPAAIDRAPSHLDLDRVGPWFLLRCPWIVAVIWRANRRIQKLATSAHAAFEQLLPTYHAWLDQEREQAHSGLSSEELLVVLNRRIQRVLQEFAPRLLLPGVIGATLWERLRQGLSQLCSPVAAEAYCLRLLQQLKPAASEELNQAIAQRSNGLLSESEFLARFGHRCQEEMELAHARWREDPSRIPRWKESELPTSRGISLKEAEESLQEFLAEQGASHGWDRCHTILQQAFLLLPLRENAKSELMRGYALLRDACEALAVVTKLGADLYFLTLAELQAAKRVTASEISRRKQEWLTLSRLPHPPVIDERGLIFPELDLSGESVERQGIVISPGVATGFAWFPDRHPGESPPRGSILVCNTLPTHFVSHFASAVAVVVDQSATLSHGAILARQFRIPVICQAEATQLIRDGDEVHVDGNSSSIHISRRR
jgi:phosphohistidine swiveling domain-containing protein